MGGFARLGRDGPAALRVVAAVLAGLVAAGVVGGTAGWHYAPAIGWVAAAVTYVAWTWAAVGRMGPPEIATHATREDPTRGVTEIILVLASLASLTGVGYLLTANSTSQTASDVAAGIGIASVASAWAVVHTVYSLRYARLYYGGVPGGVDFKQEEPGYTDFAYLAFTIGMTFQVSDTDLQTRAFRATALRHALLSYLLGAVVIGTVINLVASLGR